MNTHLLPPAFLGVGKLPTMSHAMPLAGFALSLAMWWSA
jgi:hypothetical protein